MNKKGFKNRMIRLVKNLLALLVVAAILFPIIWMLPAAFKDRTELFAIPNQFLPAEWSRKTGAAVATPVGITFRSYKSL